MNDYDAYLQNETKRVQSYGPMKPISQEYDASKLEQVLSQYQSQIMDQTDGGYHQFKADQMEIRWTEHNTPQLWIQEDGNWFLTFCLNGAYGGFDLTENAKKWIAQHRGSFYWYESSDVQSEPKEDVEDDSYEPDWPGDRFQTGERQNAWLTLAFLVLGEDGVNSEDDRGTRLYLQLLQENYYRQRFFRIEEYDGSESLEVDERVMKIWRQGQDDLSSLSLVLATQRHTMDLMQAEIDDLRLRLRQAGLRDSRDE